MSKIKTAKDILISTDFLESREKAGKYVKHEFQDYAYRLASDLGDLPHRAIYMKLAKSVDRTTLEQAAAFAMDYEKEANKGKIFMWRLSQLREATEVRKKKRNFDYVFVLREMGKLFDQVARAIGTKQKKESEKSKSTLTKLVKELNPVPGNKRNPQVLVLGSGAGSEAGFLAAHQLRAAGLEISQKLAKHAKAEFPDVKFVMKRDPLTNSYKDGQFAAVYCPRMWELLPLAAEEAVLTEVKRLLEPAGRWVVQVLLADEEVEGWHAFMAGEKELLSFSKKNDLAKLEKKYRKLGFALEDSQQLSEGRCELWLRLAD